MTKGKVLIVEDDPEIARLTTMYLEAEEYQILVIEDGALAINAIHQFEPDLILLDLMLPGLNGDHICRQAREFYQGMILVLTASVDEVSEVSLFKFGADDYVTKPIRGHVLLARIEALMRRAQPRVVEAVAQESRVTDISVDTVKQIAYYKNHNLNLTSAEFEILNLLVMHHREVVTREECCKLFRGIDYSFNDRSIDMRISGLRRKLANYESEVTTTIRTIRNKGYMLVA